MVTLLMFFFSAVLLLLFIVRWLRWLGIAQKKEYRLDRFAAFFASDEGKFELKKFFPAPAEFSRTGMKRPRITPRVLIVAGLSFSLSLLVVSTAAWLHSAVGALLAFILAYFLIPVIVILACLPSTVVSWFVVYRTLQRAAQKLRRSKPQIIGIGGSYGKTSTKHLLHHVLSQHTSVFVTPKSFNTKYSIAKSILDFYQGEKIALLEYGAYTQGEIAYMTSWFPPVMAVETGFTPQHLSLFGSRQQSVAAEAELIAALPKQGVVFCNGADPGAVEICRVGIEQSHASAIFYSGNMSDVQLSDLKVNAAGEGSAVWNGKRLHTKLVGKQYLVNLQAAIAVSQYLGMSDEKIREAIESFVPNDSFIQGMFLKTGAYVIDDGATSNPKGFAAALDLIEELPFKEKIVLTAGLIDLGDESDQIHRQLAERAQEIKATVVYLGVDGMTQFQEVLGKKLVTSAEHVFKMLAGSDKDTVFLIEGKIPKDIEDKITGMKKV